MIGSITLLAGAGHKPTPVIDFDATILLQTGVFLLLYVVLRRLVFLPYLETREQRTRLIEGARAEGEALGGEAKRKLETYQRRVAEARQQAAAERARVRAQGEDLAREQLTTARGQATTRLEGARASLADSAPAAALALRARADQLAAAVASKVLGRTV